MAGVGFSWKSGGLNVTQPTRAPKTEASQASSHGHQEAHDSSKVGWVWGLGWEWLRVFVAGNFSPLRSLLYTKDGGSFVQL